MSPMPRTPFDSEFALLGFLAEQPMHGYEIWRRLSAPAELGEVWRIKQSQLYALLGRLAEAGYISASAQPQPTRPARNVFALTPTGREAFEQWVTAPVAHGRQLRLEFLLKLYFARRRASDAALALIAAQRDACEGWQRAAEQAAASAAAANAPYVALVHTFRAGQIAAMLAWLDQCALPHA